MARSFSASVDAWARKSKARMRTVFQTAAQTTIEQAQRPVGDGGRMRVDTGFLRASGQTVLNGWPSGPSKQDEGNARNLSADLVIAGADIGDVIAHGWTAEYARAREVKDGFMEGAAENWQRNVDAAARTARRRFP